MPTHSTSNAASGVQTVRLAELGPDVTGRSLGARVREQLAPGVAEVIFDCEDVEAMSPSFADELFGKLAAEPVRPHVRVINATPDVLATIRFAVSERTANGAGPSRTEDGPQIRPRSADRFRLGDPRRRGPASS